MLPGFVSSTGLYKFVYAKDFVLPVCSPLPCYAKISAPLYRAVLAFNGKGALILAYYGRKMEPDWTKSIPDWVICDWFYIIFIVDVILFSILIFIALWLLFTIKGSKVLLGGRLFMYLITGFFGITTALFYYLLCDRSLNPK